jgi:ATP-binding protein involved in chromosome partitioning
MITKEQAIELIRDVKHPAIDHTLLDLGIVKHVSTDEDKVYVTFAFPFPSIPIADTLIRSISEPLQTIGAHVMVDMVLMTEEEKQNFLRMEQEAWKGLEGEA